MAAFAYAYLQIIQIRQRDILFPDRNATDISIYLLFVYTGDEMENRSVGREGRSEQTENEAYDYEARI